MKKSIVYQAVLGLATVFVASTASAQNTGAGSTMPTQSRQYQQLLQQQQQARNTYYIQQAPQQITQQQQQEQAQQALRAWTPLGGCVTGAVAGAYALGGYGAAAGCAAGGLGITRVGSARRLIRVEQAY